MIETARVIAGLVPSAALLTGMLVAATAEAQTRWEQVSIEPDGLELLAREVPETDFPELRVIAVSQLSPAALMEAAWELRDVGVQALYLDTRVIKAESVDDRLIYFRVSPPVIGKRDCTLEVKRRFDAPTGTWRMTFAARASAVPAEGVRPFTQLRGEWTFTPDGAGHTRVEYRVIADPGGVIAWLAKRQQRATALATVRETLARAPSFALAAGLTASK